MQFLGFVLTFVGTLTFLCFTCPTVREELKVYFNSFWNKEE